MNLLKLIRKNNGFTASILALSIQCTAQTPIKIPIEFAQLGGGECIVAKGLELKGKKLNLVFDTGGSGSGIIQQTIDDMQLKPDTFITVRGNGGEMKVPFFTNNKFISIDGASIEMNLALFPLPPALLKDGSKSNGLLGLGSLTNYNVEINFDEMMLTISETPILGSQESIKLKTHSDRGIRFFEGSLITKNAKPITGPIYFDTGNTSRPMVINQRNFMEHNLLNKKEELEKVSIGGVGPNKKDAYKMQLPGFEMAGILFKDIPVLVTDPDGFSLREDIAKIGLKLIKKFNIVFDRSGEYVLLTKSRFFEEPFDIIEKREGKTPTDELLSAIREGNLDSVKSIWKSNPNLSKVNVMSPQGNTALQTAILAEKTEIAIYLIEQKVELNTQNTGNGATALHLAVYKRNMEVIKLLVAAGADITIKDSRGSTPMQMAEMLKFQEAVELLK